MTMRSPHAQVASTPRSDGSSERGSGLMRRLDRWVGIPLCFLLGLIRRRRQPAPTRPRRIGVLIFGAIGDALLASAILAGQKQRHPEAEVYLILSDSNKGVAQLLKSFDDHLVIPVSRPWQAVRQLRALQLDVLIDTTQWARISAVVSFFSGAGLTVGFSTPGQHRAAPYGKVVAHSNARHELENFQALCQAAGGAVAQPALAPPPPFDPEQHGLHEPFIVLHPWAAGTRCELREWPDTHWQALAQQLKQAGYSLCITGARSDMAAAARLQALLPDEPGTVSLAGQLTLPALAGCLRMAAAVVSVNTGVMHLAALLGCRVVSLNGPTNAVRWGGVGPRSYNLDVPPSEGGAFLNLGFEYPKGCESIMHKISPDSVVRQLAAAGLNLMPTAVSANQTTQR